MPSQTAVSGAGRRDALLAVCLCAVSYRRCTRFVDAERAYPTERDERADTPHSCGVRALSAHGWAG